MLHNLRQTRLAVVLMPMKMERRDDRTTTHKVTVEGYKTILRLRVRTVSLEKNLTLDMCLDMPEFRSPSLASTFNRGRLEPGLFLPTNLTVVSL